MPDEVTDAVLVSASDLLPPEEEQIPPEPDQSEPPTPGDTEGQFFIEKNRFGPGTTGIDFVHGDGEREPVMVMLQRLHPDWTGAEVADWLVRNGLPQEHAVRLGRQRTGAQEGAVKILEHPAVAQLAENEAKHVETKNTFAKAFLDASKRKEKKG